MRIPFVLLMLLLSQWVMAAAKTWTGASSTAWSVAGNWSGSTLPGSGDDITIPTNPSGGRMPVISSDYTVKSITIQTGATLTHTAGVLSVINGDLTVSGTYLLSGGTFLSNNALTVNNGGIIQQSGGTIHMASSTGTNPTDHIVIAANGDFELSAGTVETKDLNVTAGSPAGTFTQTGGTFRVYHDFKNKGIYNASAGLIEFANDGGGAAFPVEVTSTNTQFYNVQINSGVNPGFDNQVISFNVAGNWIDNSGVDLSPKASTVIFNGSGTQSIGGSQSTIFRNLTINKTSGIVVLSADQSIKNGNLSITGGTFDLDTYTLNRSSAGGTLTLSNGCTLKLAANTGGQTGSNFPLDFSTYSLGSGSTVEYDGNNAVTQTIFGGITYGHLTLTNGSGSGSAAKITTASITVSGNLTVNTAAVLTPGASNTVGGSGTLTGSGTVKVTRTAATADFNTQYPISTKVLSSLTVDYFATAAQTVNALNYYHLTISGSRTSNSVTLANSGTIGISGVFTPSASFSSGNYILTGSTVDFNGTSAQNIPAFTFNNLTVSSSAKTATGVINVNSAFTLNGSVLTTTSTNLLIIKDNGTASGAGASAYVNGPVRKVGNDAFTFPVGKTGTGYMAVGISAPSLATDAFTAEYMRSSATGLGPVSASGLVRVSNCDYWNLDRTTGSSTVNVTLSWNGYSNCNVAAYVNDLSSLTVAHFNGTTWDSHANSASTGNVSIGTITRNGVSSFSPFTIGSTNDYANPLQVSFTAIQATRQAGAVEVNWTNLAETNIDHYEIEHAVNGGSFTKAGETPATGNNGNEARYNWWEKLPLSASSVYRIRAVGTDGHAVYSAVVKTTGESASSSSIHIYPNPAEGGRVNLYSGNLPAGNYQVQVIDMQGRILKSQSLIITGAAAAACPVQLPSGLQPGVYSLRISGPSFSQVKSFITR